MLNKDIYAYNEGAPNRGLLKIPMQILPFRACKNNPKNTPQSISEGSRIWQV